MAQRKSKQERHEEILAAAAKVIATKGYRGASIKDLGAELDMTGAALYYYVEHKEDLLVEILQRAGERFHAAVKEIVDADMPPERKLRLFFRRHLEMMIEQDRAIFSILFYERSEIPTDRIEELTAGERESFATARKLIEEVKGPEVDSRMAALAMIGMLNWVLRWFHEDGDYALTEVADAFFEIFLHGIRPAGTGPGDGAELAGAAAAAPRARRRR
ncbi:MAG TPA: TetR/AcrR family transcriptional regulator [Solirubrobacteraceae bacterium]|nr:TetR/AcrR family transcriptional regulator [Solirubrobacteraceae bacterium]